MAGKVPFNPIQRVARAKINGIWHNISPPCMAKYRHAAGHVKGRGHKNPRSGFKALNQFGGQRGILGRIARFTFKNHTVRRNTRLGEQHPRHICAGKAMLFQAERITGKYHL